MAHDFSHLDEAAMKADPIISSARAVDIVSEVLSAITPSDLAALLAEKCPGWVAVYHEANDAQCKAIMRLWLLSDQTPVGGDFRLAEGYWKKFLAAAPKLGDE